MDKQKPIGIHELEYRETMFEKAIEKLPALDMKWDEQSRNKWIKTWRLIVMTGLRLAQLRDEYEQNPFK